MPRPRAATSWPTTERAAAGARVPRRRECVHGVEIDSESVLYDEDSGRLHFLNWSASAVWWSIDGRSSADELAAGLAVTFAAGGPALRDDVLGLLTMLGSQQLIEQAPARSGGPANV